MIDTHTHLYMREDFPDGGLEAVVRAIGAGVEKMVFPNVGIDSAEPLQALCAAAPSGTAFMAAGLHPEEVDRDWRHRADDVFAMFEGQPVVAIGEVGIDLYHDATWRTEQMDALGCQMDKARADGLPVIIHCREALDEVLHVAGMFDASERPSMVFHSFTYGPKEVAKVLAAVPDAMFGVNGVVTFKNAAEVREAVKAMGIGRIMLETDSPYLAPVPNRGRTNESANLPYVRDMVGSLLGLTPEETDEATGANARRFFRI